MNLPFPDVNNFDCDGIDCSVAEHVSAITLDEGRLGVRGGDFSVDPLVGVRGELRGIFDIDPSLGRSGTEIIEYCYHCFLF